MTKRELFAGKKAVLIDMDGVLYDSMPGHNLAWQRLMREVGVECTRDEFYLYEGMTGEATINLLFRRAFGRDCEPERAKELYNMKSRYFKEMGSAKPMPGADQMLGAFGKAGLKRVLVTGSGQLSLLDALQRDYPGVFGEGMRVTAHDVARGKPDPEPYLKGATKADVKPEECIVVENAPLGVRAGKAAGCFTIAVTTGPIPPKEFKKEGADLIFPSMTMFALWLEADRMAALTDANVRRLVDIDWTIFDDVMVVPPGEKSKSLENAAEIWRRMSETGMTRQSVLVNVGGGVVTDLGGFCASTFKRGIKFVNIPTSLLAMADAAIGGKTGIDFLGLKNEIGTFACTEEIIVSPEFLKTLPEEELRSGFAEVVKMALLTSPEIYDSLLGSDSLHDKEVMERAVRHAAEAKKKIVAQDPHEEGLRRILNFGHTAGHAFESYAAETGNPISHGEAVAHGMMHALELSRDRLGFPAERVKEFREKILHRYYRPLPFPALGQNDTESGRRLLELMAHDKKNLRAGEINYILIPEIGHYREIL